MSVPPFHTLRFEMAQLFPLSPMSVAGVAASCPCLPSLACTPALGALLPATVPLPSDALKQGPTSHWPEPFRRQALEAWLRTKQLWPGDWIPLPRVPTLGTVEGQSLGLSKPTPPFLCPGLRCSDRLSLPAETSPPALCLWESGTVHLADSPMLKMSFTSIPGQVTWSWPPLGPLLESHNSMQRNSAPAHQQDLLA